METSAKTTATINDLIEINNDRVAGFEKAIADLKDENSDLKELFQQYAEQSRKNGQELAAFVSPDEVETGTSVGSNIHRAWIDVKSIFTEGTRLSILSEAERGEDAIKKAYQDALGSGEIGADAAPVISTQAQEIYAAHDRIKALRDASKN